MGPRWGQKGEFVSSALITVHFLESASFLLPRDASAERGYEIAFVRLSVRL